METKFQRIGREQRERQAAREARMLAEHKSRQAHLRAVRKIEAEARRERRYLETLVRD